jgi:malate dehydrogenase
MRSIKVAVTGAAGQIGYSLLFRIASGEMFGLQTAVELRLIEVPEALSAAEGVIMELQDCAFPLLKNVYATDCLKDGFDGADWAFLVGSVPRKAGMERNDLLKINGGIFIEQGKALDVSAKETCNVLVVGNPCNTNAFILKAACRRIPERNIFAMTLLDQNRAAAQLALKAGLGVEAVSNIAVWGNHSATQYPDFYNAKIHGQPVLDVIQDERWLQEDFVAAVQKRGASVIEARGRSSAASAANAIVGTVQKLIQPTPEGEIFSLAVSSDGSYGIEEGLIFSFPVRSDGKTWQIVQGLKMNDFAKKKIASTLDELRRERDAVQKIFLKKF